MTQRLLEIIPSTCRTSNGMWTISSRLRIRLRHRQTNGREKMREEEIRDNWDDEDEDKEKTGDSTTSAPAKSKKKKLADKIAEKEAKQQEEIEKRRKELEDKSRTQSPEEKLEEKLRLQKIQEDADLELANDLVGSTVEEDLNIAENKVLDEIDLSDRDGLQSFRKALVNKIRSTDRLEKRPFFVNFVEDLSRDLCENLEMEEVKRVSSVLNSLYNEKVKASKPKSKKKGNKPKLNVAQGAIIDIGNDYGAEYDDFM
ncbi:eukaryotic translation initiation factor 3 subunit J-like [Macrobrachium nipponense]|uniref:eukaryotic translation initiation factor 3 subunit J-like n=1 Tax=Macrobrachium nipponense TaxID=159736 RepID=UPI0030C7B114